MTTADHDPTTVDLAATAVYDAIGDRLLDGENELIARAVLDAIAGRLLPEGGQTREEWALRVDEPHPARREKAGAHIRLGSEHAARRGPSVWAGWTPVHRTVHVGPWGPVPDTTTEGAAS